MVRLTEEKSENYTRLSVSLYSQASQCELFRLSPRKEEFARSLCCEVAGFLQLHTRDDTKPYDISDVAYLLNVAPEIRAILVKYTGQLQATGIYAGAKIPEQLLNDAIQHYAKKYAGHEEPLLLIDTRNGALLTATHLYTRDPETKQPLHVDLAKYADIRIFQENVIYADGEKILDLGLSQDITFILARMLKQMTDYHAGTAGAEEPEIPVFDGSCAVVLIFGALQPNTDDSVFILSNPDFEHKDRAMNISEVYLDAKTADPLILERASSPTSSITRRNPA